MSSVKYYVFAVIILCSARQYLGNFKAYFPPSSSSTYPRLVIGTLPTLNEFTFCSWVRLFDSRHTPYIFSYSANGTYDVIAVYLRATLSNCLQNVLQVKNHIASYHCCFANWMEVSWRHICATWFGPDGSMEFFVNGQSCSAKRNSFIYARGSLQGGGVVVLGQNQHLLGNPSRAWHGDITGLNLWSEVLSDDQIKEAGKCDGKRNAGDVIAWSKTPMTALDGIIVQEAEVCLRY